METFSVVLALCAGKSPETGEFPSQREVTQSFDIFFWSKPKQTVEQTTEKPAIWDIIALIMTLL